MSAASSQKPVALQELRDGDFFTDPGSGRQLQVEAAWDDGSAYLSDGGRGWEASATRLAAMGFRVVPS